MYSYFWCRCFSLGSSFITIANSYSTRVADIFTVRYFQPISLAIHRNDYMAHGDSVAAAQLKQVEINTISAGAGCFAQHVNVLHQLV